MGLHARQVAAAAGAEGVWIEKIAQRMVEENSIRVDRAEELLKEWSQDDR
jgi:hydroxymethylglutaryl-CoA reductase